jgi:2-oxoisovalerate dehydrogenase E1 component
MITNEILRNTFKLMCYAQHMADIYEQNRAICKYVHSTSRGHEAIQLATAFQLKRVDWVSPYYRDESLLLGLGFEPYELMLQLLAKADDPFTGGREYYAHPNYKGNDKPNIIHQSSATGMQVIPTTGIAQGLKFLAHLNPPKGRTSLPHDDQPGDYPLHVWDVKLSVSVQEGSPPSEELEGAGAPVVICSLGDASITEGEVSEAFQFAVLKKLPIIYLVQDNEWGISVRSEEARAMDAYEYAGGFNGMNRIRCNGSDFKDSYETMQHVVDYVREHQTPYLVQAYVPLLNHHTSGVRKEFYRSKEDLEKHFADDPFPKLKKQCIDAGITEEELKNILSESIQIIESEFQKAVQAVEPNILTVEEHVFVPSPVLNETGERSPIGNKKIVMVDAALFAIREIMEDHPEALLYGQDVGRRLGGVFREAATLADQFGDERVFNTAIQEAYIIGSTVGMCAVGAKPIVEIQFADYIYSGLNQLVTEISKSSYLSCGKFPIQTLIRVPIGAYGCGGPYHSGSIESMLLTIKGIKIVYPSNAADMKGLMKAAFLDPNPVVMLEHKGLYWSKVPGTDDAKTIEPSRDYILPLGKAAISLKADEDVMQDGESCCVITYGMGVYWAKAAAVQFMGAVEIIDLRTLFPLDEELIFETVKKHGKCLVLTEEQQNNSFAEALAHRINYNCFHYLDMPVEVLGALNLPAVPMNTGLEEATLPNAKKVAERINKLLNS